MTALVANARMYAVTPPAGEAWRALFDWLARESGVALEAIDHAFPARLSDLWARPDLGCGFVCGLPFLLHHRDLQPVAAPVPASGREPAYATALLVRREHPAERLEETYGQRVGYTAADSQSGLAALRHHLLRHRAGTPLYRETVGPLVTPRRVVEALLADRIDIGPLDSFAWALMVRHEPALGEALRVIDTTDPTPIPFLAAAPGVDPSIVARLRDALLRFDDDAIADALCIIGFAPVDVQSYDVISRRWTEARDAGPPL